MRIRRWSAAAFVLLVSGALVGLVGPGVRAADTVTMGSDAEPFALKFFPPEITVSVGDTVKWENKSDLQHDVVAQNGAFKSSLLNKGETFAFKFTTPGDFAYICTPHEDAGMKGVIKVVGGSTPSPAVTTTKPASSGGGRATTTTTKRGAQPTTTVTNGPSTTTTTTTTTTPAETPAPTPEVTSSSLPEASGDTTTTTAGHGEEAAGGGGHGGEHGGGGAEEEKKTSPIGVAFAGISTVILAGISGKLLASRS